MTRYQRATAPLSIRAAASFGAAYIGSRAGAAIAGHAVLDAYARHAESAGPPDAVVIACFGDPGLEALAEISGRPVVGFAEAGFRAAAALGGRFLVATNGAAWAEMLDDRKFYYPITSNPGEQRPVRGRRANRWMPIGPDSSVTMDGDRPDAFDHAARGHFDRASLLFE